MKQNNVTSTRRALARFLLIAFASLAPLLASADTHTWSGVGLTGNWSLPANWAANNPPAAGEAAPVVLVFPVGASRLHNTNNIAGLTIHGMTISGTGYAIDGIGAGTNLTFSTAFLTFYNFTAPNGTLGSTLNITLAGTPNFNVSGGVFIAGRMTGAGGFVKSGAGDLALTGPLENQFTGAVTVNAGSLSLNKGTPFFGGWLSAIAVPGALSIGGTNVGVAASVLLIHGDQIANTAPVTIQPSGTLYLGGNNETFGPLTMIGGQLYGDSLETTNIGTLTLTADVSVPFTPFSPSANISAHLALGGGVVRTFNVQLEHFNLHGIVSDGGAASGLTKTGPGTLSLWGMNTYAGTTLINAGTLLVGSPGGLGATNGGTVVASGAQLVLNNLSVGSEPLTLNPGHADGPLVANGSCAWGGRVTLASDVPVFVGDFSQLTLSGIVSGAGGLTKDGNGALILGGSSFNNYAGDTLVKAGALRLNCGSFALVNGNFVFVPAVAVPGYLEIGTGMNSASVQLLANAQLSSVEALRINSLGVLDLNNHSATCGPLTFNGGSAQTGTGTLTLNADVTTTASGGVLYGKLSLGGATRQFNVPGNLAIQAQISDGGASAGITKNDSGTLQLINSSTFTGPVTINAGYIAAASGGALGVGPAAVTVTSGSQLRLVSFDPASGGGPDGFTVASRTLSLAGSGPNNDGALGNIGTNDWSGPIVLPVAGVYVEVKQTSPFASLTLSGPISGGGSLWCNGLGTFRISGANDNTFAGKVSLTGTNTMVLTKSNGATAVPGPLIIGDDYGTNVVKVTRVLLGAPNQIDNSASVTFYSSGLLDLSAYNETVGPIIFSGAGDFWNGGGNITGTGTLTITDNVTNKGDAWANIFCPLSLGGQTRTFSCPGLGISVFGSISDGGGSAGVIAAGFWPLWLYGSNTYSGLTTIDWCEVGLWNDHALGSPAAGTIVTNYGTLRLHGVRVVGESLTLSSTDGYALSYEDTNTWSGPVTLADWTYIASSVVPPLIGEDQLTLSGPIGGPGDLEINGVGTIILSGAAPNTYAGKTTVYGGKLKLGKPAGTIAVPGNLFVGTSDYWDATVQLNSDHQISPGPVGYVQVADLGLLDLNNHNQTVPQLRLSDHATVNSGPNGLLTLAGNIFVTPVNGGDPVINGRMSLGGANRFITLGSPSFARLQINASISDGGAPAGFTANGIGALHLSGSNSFSGALVADKINLWVWNNFALGATNGGTVLTNGGSLTMRGMNIAGEPLTFFGTGDAGLYCQLTNSWSGPVQLSGTGLLSSYATDAVLTVSGAISGAGDLKAAGPGTVRLAGTTANTFTGTLLSGGTLLELNKTNAVCVYGPLQILDGGTVRYRSAHQILDTSPVTIAANGSFDLNGFIDSIGDFLGAGSVNLGAGVLTVGGANATNTYTGSITGAGGELDKIGLNTLILAGANSYTSGTLVKGGTLIVTGSQPASDVYVYPGATLCGNGTIGRLYGLGGKVSPGNSVGKLNCGNVTLNANTTFAVELKGTNANLFDQLNVTGNVIINSGVILDVFPLASGAVSNQFTIVANDFADLVLGSFAGLPEGATFASHGVQYRISYHAGASINQVMLTQLTPGVPAQFSGITRLGNGTIQLGGTGFPGASYAVQGNFDLNTTNWLNLGTIAAATPSGQLQFIDLDATNHPMRFYRFLLP